MTYAELQQRMSSQEFELWIALAMVKADECPGCGRRADEAFEWMSMDVKCPLCKLEYHRMRSVK